MAKYVVCLDCEAAWHEDARRERERIARRDEFDSGIFERFLRGKARRNMICDGACGCDLPAGVQCCAITALPPGARDEPGWESQHVEPLETPRWWWLSFADASRPKGETFLGAAVVGPDPGFMAALARALDLGCNPGGEVLGSVIDEDDVPKMPDRYRGRLLTKADVEALSLLLGGPGELERMR